MTSTLGPAHGHRRRAVRGPRPGEPRYNRNDAFAALRNATATLGRAPSASAYTRLGLLPSAGTIAILLGSWNEALLGAGLPTNRRRNQTFSLAECRQAIQTAARILGRPPFIHDLGALAIRPIGETIRGRYASWEDALADAGFDPALLFPLPAASISRSEGTYPKVRLLLNAELRRRWDYTGYLRLAYEPATRRLLLRPSGPPAERYDGTVRLLSQFRDAGWLISLNGFLRSHRLAVPPPGLLANAAVEPRGTVAIWPLYPDVRDVAR